MKFVPEGGWPVAFNQQKRPPPLPRVAHRTNGRTVLLYGLHQPVTDKCGTGHVFFPGGRVHFLQERAWNADIESNTSVRFLDVLGPLGCSFFFVCLLRHIVPLSVNLFHTNSLPGGATFFNNYFWVAWGAALW